MNFADAIKAMDEGKTVMMTVNPECIYRLAKDGVSFVSKNFVLGSEEWRSAAFFTRHIRGDWKVVDCYDVLNCRYCEARPQIGSVYSNITGLTTYNVTCEKCGRKATSTKSKADAVETWNALNEEGTE